MVSNVGANNNQSNFALRQGANGSVENLQRDQALNKLRQFYQSRGQTDKLDEKYLQSVVDKIYARFDQDGDGTLDRTDLHTLRQEVREKRISQIAQTLSRQPRQTPGHLDIIA